MIAAWRELEELLRSRFTTSETQREHHSHGESYHAPALPDAVCFPKSTEEVSAVLRICVRHGVPVIPFGGATSVEGNVNPLRGGIAVDLREMNRIVRVSVPDAD